MSTRVNGWGAFAPYERFAAGKISAQAEFISAEHRNHQGAKPKKKDTLYSVSFFLGRATRLELATGIPQMAVCHLQEPCRTSDEICACGARWRQRVRAQNEKDPSAASLKDLSFWSGRRGSNSLPPPWQGGALPDELRPRNNGYFNKPCRNCQALFHFFLLPSAANLPPAVKAASGAPVGGGLCPPPPVWTERHRALNRLPSDDTWNEADLSS